HELLRVPIGQREPRALNLNHDAMALSEGMRDVRHLERDPIGHAWLERHRLLEALAEFAAERFAADELLIASERCKRRRRGSRRRGRRRIVSIRRIAWIHIA